MPLLRKKPFTCAERDPDLKDTDEVFFCSLTGEIFTEYEEYCERIILVNSMVWSCEFTGKANLTYAEALESEKEVRRLLRDFPLELRIPIIYLASITRRCLFTEMSEDVFLFVRDKFFVGETVEVNLGKDDWCVAHVLAVTNNENVRPPSQNSPAKCCMLYNYEVERFEEDADGNVDTEITVVPGDRIKRSRGVYTREKNKLFLRQFIEQEAGGIVRIKREALERYNIARVRFDQIFVGGPPAFPSSKKLEKLMNSLGNVKKFNERKPRQESMAKYVTKTNKLEGAKSPKSAVMNGNDGKSLAKNMQRLREDRKRKISDEKMKKKEKSLRFAAYIKEWNKQKEDLELVDHKRLPLAIPVNLPGIPNKYFGDVMFIMEFLNDLSKTIKMRDFFPSGFDLDLLCRALTAKEVAGPLTDLMQMLLTAVFMLQGGEAEEYNGMKIPNVNIANLDDDEEEDGPVSNDRAILLATAAAHWPETYLSTGLRSLPMDSQTFTEVLRLHLLTSGCDANERCLKWRYQQRGGYNCFDDPGLILRKKKPRIIKALSKKHVTELSLTYKLDLIRCLMSQILTYASVRDQIEEKWEKVRSLKNQIRSLQIEERKREVQLAINRAKLRKTNNQRKIQESLKGEKAAAIDAETKTKIAEMVQDAEVKKANYEKKIKALQSEYFSYQNLIGHDRAYRKYWLYQTVPGLFIEHNNDFNGTCLTKPVIPDPSLATAPPEDALNYVQRLFESEIGGYSDKENDNETGSKNRSLPGTPRKPLPENSRLLLENLLMCTMNEENCPVHSHKNPEIQWSFMFKPEQIDELIDSLNKRGLREGEFKQTLEQEKDEVVTYIAKCPVTVLNPTEFPPPEKPEILTRMNKRYAEANLKFPPGTDINEVLEMTLRDAIIDIEEQIHLGCLGELQVKDRAAWRETILKRDYDKQCLKLNWGPNRSITDDLQIINGKTKPDDLDPTTYKDPSYYLGKDLDEHNSDSDCEEDTPDISEVVKSLASALLQLGQAIHPKFLKKPLGHDTKAKQKDPKLIQDLSALKKWELSLMECTSFAQVTLHLAILDNSITWSKSVLNANCRICRRRNDPEKMLLCDSCNKGHHLYCLKPKLAKIPEGDWYCIQCKPQEKTPQKKNNRKVFNDDSESESEDNDSKNDEDFEEEDGKNSQDNKCQICSSEGFLIQCITCSQGYHAECLGKTPRRNAFVCSNCVGKPKKNTRERAESFSSDDSDHRPLRKKPAPKSRPKSSRRSAPVTNGEMKDSEASDNHPLSVLKSKRTRASKENSPTNGFTNGDIRKAKLKRFSLPETNGVSNGQTRKSRRSEAFHKSHLEELLNDILNNKDSWPFSSPVTVDQVPDYFEIITNPMDFGTIKTNLSSNKYTSDTQFMADSLLVFNNCFEYNKDDDPVAKAGVRLRKFFEKKCKDLGLVGLPTEDDEPNAKKFRHF